MTAYTETTQTRRAVTLNDVQKFELIVDVTEKGDLPDVYLFTVEIEDATDPKEDSFARVVTVDDIEELSPDRVTAVAANAQYYRVKSWTFFYDNVDTAANATDVLKSRLDELVEDWRTYLLKFETTSEVTEHPRVDTDTFNSLVDTYELALGTQQTALVTKTAALATYNTAVTAAAAAALAVSEAQTNWDNCTTARAWFQALYDAMKVSGGFYQHAVTFDTAAEAFRIAATGAYPVDEATFVTAQNAFAGRRSTANTAIEQALVDLGLFSTMCATMATTLSTAQAAKTTADLLVSTTRTASEDAKTAYEAAQSASEAALAAVRALKPDYDPTTASADTSAT